MSQTILSSLVDRTIDRHLAQPEAAHATTGGRALGKGLLAGLVAGLVATAVKSAAERVYPPRTEGQPEPPAELAGKLAGHELAPASKAVAAESIHWVFGAAAGAAYGAIAEFYPPATSRHGANFGLTLMAIAHEGVLPALGLAAEPASQTARERSSEMVTHIVFGLAAETVRRFVRSRV